MAAWASASLAAAAVSAFFFCAGVGPGCVIAVEGNDIRRLEDQQALGDFIQEIAIVADADDCTVEIIQGTLEGFAGIDIEVVRRLVHDQDVGAIDEELGDGDSGAFAAAEHTDGFVNVFVAEEHEGQDRANVGVVDIAADADFLRNGVIGIEFAEALIVVAEFEARAQRTSPASSSRLPRRTSRSVVFPEPLGPMIPMRSPRVISSLTSDQRGLSP